MSDVDMSGIETMTPEQRNEWFQSQVNEYVTKNGYKKPEEITGLVNKNHEIIAEKKRLQARLKEIENDPSSSKARLVAELLEQGGVFSPDDDADTIKQKLQKAVPVDKYSELEVKLRRMEKQLADKAEQEKALLAQAEQERNKRYNSEKDRVIASTLDSVGLLPEAKEVFLNYFSGMAKVSENEGKLNIFVEDKEGLMPSIDAHIKAWAKSDQAKAFIKAPVSVGAGISGGGKGPGGGRMTLDDIEKAADVDTRIKLLKDNGYL